MGIFRKHFALLTVLVLTIFAILPLFHSGFFSMHDDEQIARLFDLNQALFLGQFPPRIAPNLGYGYGYPFFNFYPAFAYYIAEIFVLLGFGYIVSTKLMIAIGFIFAAVFMYEFTKQYFGNIGGVVSSVLYTYAPYHAVDVYVRGALAEFLSFVFIPAIFLGYFKLSKKPTVWLMLFTSIVNSGLILSHNLVAVMTVPFLGLYWIFLFLTSDKKRNFAISSSISFIFSLCLTAYFWIPSYFEKQYTLVEILTKELANYNLHFVCPSQFWNSSWGYGASLVGCQTDGLSFQVGKVLILLVLLSLFVAYTVFKYKKTFGVIVVFLGLFIFSLFIQTKYSKFVWDAIQQLAYIQFPWRFLIFSVFTASFLSASIFILKFEKKMKFILAAGIIILTIFLNKNYFEPEKYYSSATDNDYTNTKKIRWETSNLAYEYVPKGIYTKKSPAGTTVITITEQEYARSAFQIKSGQMNVDVEKNLPQEKKFLVTVKYPGQFLINTYAFPGWVIFVDSQKTFYTSDNRLKLIAVSLSQGNHTIQAYFENTFVRKIGNFTSLVSLALLIAIFVRNIFAFYAQKHVK